LLSSLFLLTGNTAPLVHNTDRLFSVTDAGWELADGCRTFSSMAQDDDAEKGRGMRRDLPVSNDLGSWSVSLLLEQDLGQSPSLSSI